MRDFQENPAWQASDLGVQLADEDHAVSVCLPTWDSVLGYEKGLKKVTDKMKCGYPRFFLHPAIRSLFEQAKTTVCEAHEDVVVFPHKEAAQRALLFVEKRIETATRISSFGDFQCLIVPQEHVAIAMEYWRFTGEIISSRMAQDFLNEVVVSPATEALRTSLAQHIVEDLENIYLYENGMSAVFAAFRASQQLHGGKKTLQLEFPYVDVLKIQQHFGSGVVFLNECEGKPFTEALQRIRAGEFSAVFCETPSNPLLRSVDLEEISKACREGGVILIVDDTVCSSYNVDVSPYADLITTSLTKWHSGKCNVMGGAVRIGKNSPFRKHLLEFFKHDNPSGSRIHGSDADVLLENLEGYEDRMETVNKNGLHIAQFLYSHPAVDEVWYPSLITKEYYNKLKTEHGGYGGLLSFTLNSPKKAPKVFDALEVTKGPSLGTEFSLACPYTLLAHYEELKWAEDCGVASHLIRISIGAEPIEQLKAALTTALAQA